MRALRIGNTKGGTTSRSIFNSSGLLLEIMSNSRVSWHTLPKRPYQLPLITQKRGAIGCSRSKLAFLWRATKPAHSSIFVLSQSYGNSWLLFECESVGHPILWFGLETSSSWFTLFETCRLWLKFSIQFFWESSSGPTSCVHCPSWSF